MPAPSSSHVWTAGRAHRPTLTTAIRAALRQRDAGVVDGGAVPVVALVASLAAALVATLAVGGASADAPADAVVAAAAAGTVAGVGSGTSAPTDAAPSPDAAPAGPLRFAAVDGVNLFVTSPAAKIVGFHQASYPNALTMLPVGKGLVFDNGQPRHVEEPGPNFVVMGSRGRPTAPTSAVDIAQEPGAGVVSAVTGTVVDVQRYSLYGRYPDTRIEIAPAGRPDLRVVMLHVTDTTVAPGDPVEAGRTQVARTATHFPFTSHVDRYAGGRPPHVHVEVKRV